jgi:hypothetical protein
MHSQNWSRPPVQPRFSAGVQAADIEARSAVSHEVMHQIGGGRRKLAREEGALRPERERVWGPGRAAGCCAERIDMQVLLRCRVDGFRVAAAVCGLPQQAQPAAREGTACLISGASSLAAA